MNYVSAGIPDTLSVSGIFTVHQYSFSGRVRAGGEAHDFPELIYVIRGKHSLSLDSRPYELSAGQLMIYEPGAYHELRGLSEAEVYIISFELSGGSLAEIYNRVITLTPSQKRTFISIMDGALACFTKRAAGSAVRGMITKDGTSEYELSRIRKQLEFFLIDIQPEGVKKSSSDTDFDRVANFLSEHLSENLTLTDIAAGTGMSVSKLKMLTREKCGGGAINYFIEMKIEEAKRKISIGELNFTEIAESLGFCSLHYFSRIFKKVVGVTPSEYKANGVV